MTWRLPKSKLPVIGCIFSTSAGCCGTFSSKAWLCTSIQTKACHGDLCSMFTMNIPNQDHHHAISCPILPEWYLVAYHFNPFRNIWPFCRWPGTFESAEFLASTSRNGTRHCKAIWPVESLMCSAKCLGIHRWITQITTLGRNQMMKVERNDQVDSTSQKSEVQQVKKTETVSSSPGGSQGKAKRLWFVDNCHGGCAITSPGTKNSKGSDEAKQPSEIVWNFYILINHGHATHHVAPYIAKSRTMEMNSLSWNPASLELINELIPLAPTTRTPFEDTRMLRTKRNKRHYKKNSANRKNNDAYNIQQHW